VIIELLSYLGRFIILLLLQLLVIKNIELSTFINPYIYPLFILTLPVSTKPWQVVLISFITGFIVDSFYIPFGLHMAATTFMGYLRIFYLKFAANKEDFDAKLAPNLSRKGPVWFVLYCLVLIFAHHTVLFYLEVYSLSEFFRTFSRVFASSIASVALITLGQVLFYKAAQRK